MSKKKRTMVNQQPTMKEKILIDIGSSTIKIYRYSSEDLKLIDARSILFKEGFSPEKGIEKSKKDELFSLINKTRDENPDTPVEIYATAVFRKLDPDVKKHFQKEFQEKTGIEFSIISQEQESLYLQRALAGRYENDEPVLLINIGGGSTELVVMRDDKAIETKDVDLGVGSILAEYKDINNNTAGVELSDLVDEIIKKLPDLREDVRIAIYSGGELTFMRLAEYELEKNNLFTDADHPSLISFDNFIKRNKEIFEDVSLSELEALMPENPKWMHGARACSAIAQAICKKYDIKHIIPSDSNLINGVVRSEEVG